jgi:hypothetical protein
MRFKVNNNIKFNITHKGRRLYVKKILFLFDFIEKQRFTEGYQIFKFLLLET